MPFHQQKFYSAIAVLRSSLAPSPVVCEPFVLVLFFVPAIHCLVFKLATDVAAQAVYRHVSMLATVVTGPIESIVLLISFVLAFMGLVPLLSTLKTDSMECCQC